MFPALSALNEVNTGVKWRKTERARLIRCFHSTLARMASKYQCLCGRTFLDLLNVTSSEGLTQIHNQSTHATDKHHRKTDAHDAFVISFERHSHMTRTAISRSTDPEFAHAAPTSSGGARGRPHARIHGRTAFTFTGVAFTAPPPGLCFRITTGFQSCPSIVLYISLSQ